MFDCLFLFYFSSSLAGTNESGGKVISPKTVLLKKAKESQDGDRKKFLPKHMYSDLHKCAINYPATLIPAPTYNNNNDGGIYPPPTTAMYSADRSKVGFFLSHWGQMGQSLPTVSFFYS